MKYILTFSIFLFGTFTQAQTYISPIIGVDFMKIETKYNTWFASRIFNVNHKGFSIKSPFLGIKIEQNITKKLAISYETSLTRKSVNVAVGPQDLVIDNIKFNYLRNNLSLFYKSNKYLVTGIGYDFNLIKNLQYFPYGEYYRGKRLLYDHGVSLRMGAEIKNFQLMAYFHKSLHFNKNDYSDIFNINSFGICTGYRFRVFHKKSKSSDCPKF